MISDPYPQISNAQSVNLAPQGIEDSQLLQALQVLNQLIQQFNNLVSIMNIRAPGSYARQANSWTNNPTFGTVTCTSLITGTFTATTFIVTTMTVTTLNATNTNTTNETVTLITPVTDGTPTATINTNTHGILITDNAETTIILAIDTSTMRVGVGLHNPAYELDVAGDCNLSGSLYANGTGVFTDDILALATNDKISIKTHAGTAVITVDTQHSYVGINQTSPAYSLDIGSGAINVPTVNANAFYPEGGGNGNEAFTIGSGGTVTITGHLILPTS